MSSRVKEEKEIWKDIPEYEGYYQVSNLGNVYSMPRKGCHGRMFKPHRNRDGYLCVYLTVNGKDKRYFVHRLVAMVFIGMPDSNVEIDHINGVRDDNRVENLRWVSHKENCNNPLTKDKYSKSSKGRHHVVSEETRKKLSEIFRRESNPLRNKPRPKEVREKIARGHFKKILQFSLEGEFIREWESIKAAAEGTGMSKDRVGKIANGHGIKHRKFLFKFA